MERRNFLKGALAIFGAVAVGVAAGANKAEAASLDAMKDLPRVPDAEPVQAATSGEPDAQGQYYIVRRRRYYRPRRRVYYYRPRRYYRRVYRRPAYRIYW